jgi:glycogen debranching enzyme
MNFRKRRFTFLRPVRRRARAGPQAHDTFIVLDSHGDIGAAVGGPDGLFHSDTRFVSHLELLLNGMQPLLLGSSIRDDNTLMTVDLTNPDMYFDNHLLLPKDTLHVVRTVFLWRDNRLPTSRRAQPRRSRDRATAQHPVRQGFRARHIL